MLTSVPLAVSILVLNQAKKMDRIEKSIDLVKDTSKLLITLATGFIAFSVTFAKELDSFSLDTTWQKFTWGTAWLSMAISVVCGIWTQLALATVLEPKVLPDQYQPSIRNPKVQAPFAIQIVSFGVSAFALFLFGCGVF